MSGAAPESASGIYDVNFVVNYFDPDYFVNLVVNYVGLVLDKVHDVVIRDRLRQSSRFSFPSLPAEHDW